MLALACPAWADAGSQRPPVRLSLGACLGDELAAFHRAIRVELGDGIAGPDQPGVAVDVDCAPGGIDAGIVLVVRQPASPRAYRYALDWTAQPVDARPRLLGLAVAEAVDASRIELIAVPEPVQAPAIAAAATPRELSGWTIALTGHQRRFAGQRGVTTVGAGIAPARSLSAHLQLAADLLVEGTSVLTSSGAVAVRALSVAPRIAYRTAGRVYGELGAGVRLGVVRLAGEPLPHSGLVGETLVRAWLGPTATLAAGAVVTSSLAITASLELGTTATGATARDVGEPVAAIDGGWLSLGIAATIAL